MFRYDKKAVEDNNLQKRVQEDKFLKDYYNVESKSDENRTSRKLAEELREKTVRENALKIEKDRLQRQLDAAENERVLIEKESRKKEVVKNQKYRQYVRENSVELRELESKLKLSYISKLRERQIAEKELEMAEIREEELEETRKRLLDAQAAELEEQFEEEKMYKQRLIYKEELEQQLCNQREKAEQEAMALFLIEKAMLDEIVKRIIEEDQEKMREELRKRLQFKEAINEYLTIQAEFRKEQNEIIERENEEINSYLKSLECRIRENKLRFKSKQKQIKDLQDAACASLPNFRTSNPEEEELRLEIELAEKEARERLKERQRFEIELRRRVELQRGLQEQLKNKEERLRAEREEDERLRQEMLIQMAEEERIDQMTAQRKRIKRLEHKEAIEKLLADRRCRRELEKESQLEELERFKMAERTLQAIIEEERQKMIEEHAANMLGFLPNMQKHLKSFQ